MLLAVPTLTACGTNYDVTMILEKSDSYVYDNGKQEIVFNIKSKDASEYGVGFASTLDSSCIQSSDYVAGKTLSFDRLSDTSVKVSFDGDSTYSFGDDFQVEFTFKFLDKAFNKEGFHDYGNSLYLTRSHAQIDSVISGSSPKGAFGFKLYGTTLKGPAGLLGIAIYARKPISPKSPRVLEEKNILHLHLSLPIASSISENNAAANPESWIWSGVGNAWIANVTGIHNTQLTSRFGRTSPW